LDDKCYNKGNNNYTAKEMQTVMSHDSQNFVMIEKVSFTVTVTLYMYIFLTAFFNYSAIIYFAA